MILDRVKLKNFWSYPEATLEFNHTSPVVVLGLKEDMSSNGAGKSSLFEAILWGFFGKTSKNIYADAVVNSRAKQDCSVTIEGSQGVESFKIVRYRKHTVHGNTLKFYVNNSDITATTNTETQKYVEQYLQISFETFIHTCFFNPTNAKTFCALSSTEQKSIFEVILNLEKWTTLYDKVSTDLKDFNQQVFKLEIELNMLRKSRKECIGQELQPILLLKQNKQDVGKIHSKEDLERNEKIYASIAADIRKLKDQESQIRTKLTLLTNKCKELTSKLAKVKTGRCYACSQEIYTSEMFTKLREEKTEVEDDIQNYNISLQATETVLKKKTIALEDAAKKFQIAKEETLVAKEKIEKIKSLNSDLRRVQQKLKSNLLEIEEKQTLLYLISDKILKYKKVQTILSNKGIKTYLINTILPLLTVACNKYLQHFNAGEFTIKFLVDKNARLQLQVNRSTGEGYDSCSSGEMRRIDISLLLGLLEITSAFKNVPNFLILDEVFDCLDEVGVDKAVELLYNLERENIFVITHNQNFASKFQEQLMIKKTKQGESYIESN